MTSEIYEKLLWTRVVMMPFKIMNLKCILITSTDFKTNKTLALRDGNHKSLGCCLSKIYILCWRDKQSIPSIGEFV